MEARNRQGDTNRRTPNLLFCPNHALKCPGTTRIFRLLNTNLGCPALYKDPLRGQGPAPLKEKGPRPRRGAAQWTQARHAKSAPRSRTPRPVLDVKTNKRQANRAVQMLAPAPSSSDIGCAHVSSCALKRSGLMRHGGFQKYNGPENDQNSVMEKKVTKPLLAMSPGDFSGAARAPKSISIIVGNCHINILILAKQFFIKATKGIQNWNCRNGIRSKNLHWGRTP